MTEEFEAQEQTEDQGPQEEEARKKGRKERYRVAGEKLLSKVKELIQEGNVGLVTAARKFDPDQGVKFISYAVWWVRQAMLQALRMGIESGHVPVFVFRRSDEELAALLSDREIEAICERAGLLLRSLELTRQELRVTRPPVEWQLAQERLVGANVPPVWQLSQVRLAWAPSSENPVLK